jgi:hypothetical protein
MIAASLLLILVAVTLLVLGLTGGSSGLLISSIVASLLAAVALVIGARQSGAARRAAAGTAADAAAPEFAAETASPERGMDDFAQAGAVFAAESAESDLSDKRETVQFEPVAYDDFDDLEPVQNRDDDYEREAFEAGRRDTAAGMAATAPRRQQTSPGPEAGPDRDLADEAINAARSEDPDEFAWRRPEPVHAEAVQAEPVHAEPVHAEPVHAEAMATDEGPDLDADLDAGLDDADEDDPADEPLPQKVSPADAVRVARLDNEVLVVDGRPRYHVPDCPHLVGKLTEPIPVNEAVELGFSPCGLCRPVERLVAPAARR